MNDMCMLACERWSAGQPEWCAVHSGLPYGPGNILWDSEMPNDRNLASSSLQAYSMGPLQLNPARQANFGPDSP